MEIICVKRLKPFHPDDMRITAYHQATHHPLGKNPCMPMIVADFI